MTEKKDKDEKSLEKLKEEYKKLQKKHDLPSFEEMNENFSIEKLAEIQTEILIREVRRVMVEKIFGYLRTIETFINPSNAPMFVFSIVKSFSEKDKKVLNDIYKELAKNEVELINLDLEYSEEKEAEFIKDSCKIWKRTSKQFIEIIEDVKKNWDNKSETSRGYFG
ncbi:hypothetical protein HY448_00290 [Candidatus Pacearchaeota archaeon]|nr:hypothetical protein [Candidatus Pacearchaeota archaeon]